ncbi:MAG: sugar fermentation stimulation protein SfsA [Clostridiales bacterium GWB2_37_7]|nr:MAG: sugar fermentation stimulation protein SfsA [Clostridiales bacterium GWB2_37_7]
MKINNEVVQGNFIKRLNRFEAIVDINGEEILVHVPNTGRCRELFLEGVPVLLERRAGKHRKTAHELIMVYKDHRLVSVDSQLPNKLADEAIRNKMMKEFQDYDYIKREAVFGDSRFDLYLEKKDERAFVEIKGVTLEIDGVATFPDAPTERGTKHIYELINAKEQGYRACVLFVVQLDFAEYFTPNSMMDPKFGEALRSAKTVGVEIYAYSCHVRADEVYLYKPMEVRL